MEPKSLSGQQVDAASFRYFPYVMAAFVAILLLSNVIGASKPSYVFCLSSANGRSARGCCSFR